MNKKYEFNVGDIVITKLGFTNSTSKNNYAGAGYKEDFKFEIKSKTNDVAFPETGHGIYFKALELYASEPNYEVY